MSAAVFDILPLASRDVARESIRQVFGGSLPSAVARVTGGASALTYRLDVAGARWLLRLDATHDPMRNPRRGYECMRIAADAGIAPRLLHADPAAGLAIMEFIETKPLAAFPGGAEGLVVALGELVRRLHGLPAFPALMPFPDLVGRMLAFIRVSNLFAPGLLDRHAEGFERVRAAYGWNAATLVSSHNDPNPRNLLFDGRRLWLIDWETAFQNDPLTDVAIVCDSFAQTPALQAALLNAYQRGAVVTPVTAARLTLMRLMTRLYYACLILAMFARTPRAEPYASVDAPTPAEFQRQLAEGSIREGEPQTLFVLGTMLLAGFTHGLDAPDLDQTLSVARSGW